jgi:hypothetical protein
MVTLEQISVALEHPLVLLLIGAGVSGGLITWLTHWLENRRKQREIEVENRRKKLEIKVDIASKMAEAMGYQFANAAVFIDRETKIATDAERDVFYEDLKKWHADVSIIRSMLETYFPETGLKESWGEYIHVLTSYSHAALLYFLKDPFIPQETNLKYNLEEIRKYFSDNKQTDWDRFTTEMTYDEKLWDEVGDLIWQRGDEIIKDVLKLPIKVF